MKCIPPRISKWVVLVNGCIIQMVLGGLYTWGNETVYYTSWLRRYQSSLTYGDTLFTFGTTTIALAVGGLPAGLLLPKFGPQVIGIFGIVLYAAANYLAILVRSLFALVAIYGIIRGLGVGIAHITPVSVVALWFPKRIAFIQGVVAMFFGLGGFVLNYITTWVANPNNLDPDVEHEGNNYFDPNGEVSDRVPLTWIVLGTIYAVFGLISAALIYNPPDFKYETTAEHQKANESGSANKLSDGGGSYEVDDDVDPLLKEQKKRNDDWTIFDALRHFQFYLISLLFILGSMPGHVAIGVYKTHPIGMSDSYLSLVGSFGAIANGLGRLFFGFCADKFGERKVLFFMFMLQAAFNFTYPLNWTLTGEAQFTAWVCLLYFCYGGNFAIFPALTWRMFGPTYFGAIYGAILFAWGFGGLAGDTLVNTVEASVGVIPLFMTLGAVSVVAAFLVVFLDSKPTKPKPRGFNAKMENVV